MCPLPPAVFASFAVAPGSLVEMFSRCRTIPKLKEAFKPVPLPYYAADDSDSDEDEALFDFWRPTKVDDEISKSIAQCDKAIKPGRVAAGVHFVNPSTDEPVQLFGLTSPHSSLYLQVCCRSTEVNGCIALANDDKPFLKMAIQTTVIGPHGRVLKETDENYATAPRETTMEVSQETKKTVQVPKDALNLRLSHHYCFRIRKSANAAKVYVNDVEVARLDGAWRELLAPHQLLVSGTLVVKSVHVPTSAVPRAIQSPFGGCMNVGDRIVTFGTIEAQDGDNAQPIITLGDVRLFADKDDKSHDVRIVLQRYRRSLVAYKNGEPIFTSNDAEKLTTVGDLQFGQRFCPTGVWISRLENP